MPRGVFARKDPKERLLAKVTFEPNSGCWLWLGGVSNFGYGHTRMNSKFITTHRMSYYLFNGPIPDGMLVCHKCDVPSCVNPDHLWLGTAADNMRDCSLKLRARGQSATHCRSGHPYTDENIIYRMPNRVNGGRYCRICWNQKQAEYRRRRKCASFL